MNTYPAVLACARAILAGRVLLGGGMSVGEGAVLDWRRGGRGRRITTPESAACPDAFDLAHLFVSLVGVEAALAASRDLPDPVLVLYCRRRALSAERSPLP